MEKDLKNHKMKRMAMDRLFRKPVSVLFYKKLILICIVFTQIFILLNIGCSNVQIKPVFIPNEFCGKEIYLGMNVDSLRSLDIVDTLVYNNEHDSYSGILIENNLFNYLYINIEDDLITSIRFDGAIDTSNINTYLNPNTILQLCIKFYGDKYKIYDINKAPKPYIKIPYIIWEEDNIIAKYFYTPNVLFDKIKEHKRNYAVYRFILSTSDSDIREYNSTQEESLVWTSEKLGL